MGGLERRYRSGQRQLLLGGCRTYRLHLYYGQRGSLSVCPRRNFCVALMPGQPAYKQCCPDCQQQDDRDQDWPALTRMLVLVVEWIVADGPGAGLGRRSPRIVVHLNAPCVSSSKRFAQSTGTFLLNNE